jgi:uncharacterized membrane protein
MNSKESVPLGIIGIMFLIGIFFYQQMPQLIPTHWDSAGAVNGYSTRFVGLFLLPIITLGIYLFFLLIPRIEVYKENLSKFSSYFFGFKLVFVLFFFSLYIVTIFQAKGFLFNMNYFIMPALAILFFYIGHILPFVKRNFFIGIRTPWTLSSDHVWEKTHKAGGIVFKAFGVIMLCGIFFVPLSVFFILVPLIFGAAFLVIYSYKIFREEEKDGMQKRHQPKKL